MTTENRITVGRPVWLAALTGALWWSGATGTPATGQTADQDHSQEAVVIEQTRTALRFEADGTGRRELGMRIKAQSEAGVQQWGQLILGYNAASERIDIPFVRVQKPDGTVVTTPQDTVQDLSSPVLRIAPVYTDFRQKHVTVQGLRPGDTLEFSVVTTVHTAVATGQFWAEYNFNDDAVVLDEQLDIDVPDGKPITLRTKKGMDPVVRVADGRRVYHWARAHLVREPAKPETATADEPERSHVRLTTFRDWDGVGRWFGELERGSRAATPDIRMKALELTSGKKTETAKLEALYDYVSKNFRYVSLSLGAGRYRPRQASDVMRDEYGDCKDKHTLLASLADAVGLHASAVLIGSQTKLDPDFPSPSQFDHIITRVMADGQPVWLDVTPEIAPFRLLAPNLRKKQALLADTSGSSLVETPADTPFPSAWSSNVEGTVDESGKLRARVNLSFRGDSELLLRAIFRTAPAAQWKEVLQAMTKEWRLDGTIADAVVADPAATKEPFTIAFTLDVASFVTWTARNFDMRLPGPDFDVPDAGDQTDANGTLVIGETGDGLYRTRLVFPAGTKIRAPLSVAVSRDYAEYHSTYGVTGTTMTVERSLRLRQRELPGTRRADFAAFARVVSTDGGQRASIDGSAVATAPVASDAKAGELKTQAYEAVRAQDYAKAIDLLKRVVELAPKDLWAWNALGQAYANLRQTDAAIDAYKKQIEVNAFDQYAYKNLGLAYMSRARHAEAEEAFKKQIEINPLDGDAHANLAYLYMQQRTFEPAVDFLQKAIAISPNDAGLQVQIGKAYLNLNRSAEASSAFARAVELSPDPLTWNNIAYELSLKGIDLPRAQQYAQSAVDAATAASRNLDIENADRRAMGVVSSLAAYWDTLGWVCFAKGDYTTAEKYIAPSWELAQHAEVGDHLGQVYEKTGRRDMAMAAYARALAATSPPDNVRRHLEALVGKTDVDSIVDAHRADLAKSRTFLLIGKGPAGKKADFMLLLRPPATLVGLKFVEGDAEMRALGAAIERLQIPLGVPSGDDVKVLRRAEVSCPASDGPCTLTLALPEDARPAK